MADNFLQKLVLNSAGIQEVLKGPEVVEFLLEKGSEIAARCGDGYEVDTYIGTRRANVGVKAVTPEAINDCYENNTLLKNLY